MKILYVATERRAAERAVTALGAVGPDVTVSWAGSLFGALAWVDDNRDLAAVLVEAEVENQNCASFVGQVRNLGVDAPVIVLVPDQGGTPVAALKAGADDYASNGPSLLTQLPVVLGAAI